MGQVPVAEGVCFRASGSFRVPGQMAGTLAGHDGGVGVADRYVPSAMMIRRFCLPLFSIFTTCTGPISPVRAT